MESRTHSPLWTSKIARKYRWNRAYSYKTCLFKWEWSTLVSMTVWTALLIGGAFLLGFLPTGLGQEGEDFTSRHLLSKGANLYYGFLNGQCVFTNRTPSGLADLWESCDYEISTGLEGLWITFYIFSSMIIFIGLAILCDDFFMPSLEIMAQKLNMSQDVAAATLMAAGSSSPELFSSIVGVTFHSSVGIGTVTGSAAFNSLFIIALSVVVSKSVLSLDWRPITRDCLFYLISLCWLTFSIWDTVINIYDAVVMVLIYGIYMLFMVFNTWIMKKCSSTYQYCCCCISGKVEPRENFEEIITTSLSLKYDRRNSLMNIISMPLQKRMSLPVNAGNFLPILEEVKLFEETEIPYTKCPKSCGICPDIKGSPPCKVNYEKELHTAESGKLSRFNIHLVFILKWIIYVFAFPFLVIFSYTIVDCAKKKYRKYFILSFVGSIFWLVVLSFGMVVVISRVGCLIQVDTFTMSLVLLAIGASLPDLFNSLIVAREGHGVMVVSNAIGSNVFNINIGLGLPFLIRILINKTNPISLFSQRERRSWCTGQMLLMPHPKFALILLAIIIVCYLIFMAARFRLNKAVGISFFILYIAFLVYAFVQEFYCSTNKPYIC